MKQLRGSWKIWGIYAALAGMVLLPLLLPGYILTLDMVFTPDIPAPESVTSSYLFRLFLHVINFALPTPIVEKILLFIILFCSGIGTHRLLQHIKGSVPSPASFGIFVAGALYMINPFTYSRFMAGQYSVLLGYAFMPFFVRAVLRFLAAPSKRTTLCLTLWALLISIVSIHSIGLMVILIIIALALSVRRDRQRLGAAIRWGLIGLAGFLIASSYWLVPMIQGKGETAETIARFGQGDIQAFATLGNGVINQLGNVLSLQGFWAEGRGLYDLPQDRVPIWGLAVLAVWVLVAIGGRTLWRQGKRFETMLFGLSALFALLINLGPIHSWLGAVPFINGYREPHKFIGLVALTYAVFAGQAISYLIRKYQERQEEVKMYLVMAGATLLIVTLTPPMLWGFGGQLQPRQYPKDWFALNDRLNSDTSDARVLFLPWHLYMYFDFAGRIIANPADDFFDKSVVVSDNPELDAASPVSADPDVRQLDAILTRKPVDNLGPRLTSFGIKYILLAKETDYKNYDYLDRQPNLTLIQETATLKLYQNEAYTQ